LIPRDSRIAPSDAAAMPLPNEETTPPVTNTYLVMKTLFLDITDNSFNLSFYWKAMPVTNHKPCFISLIDQSICQCITFWKSLALHGH
jgi:hypothetical protein